jgi:hypothetical protein
MRYFLEDFGSADTPTSPYEIVEYLKRRGLNRIAEQISEELGLEEIDDLQYLTENLNKLEWLKDAQKEKLLKLVREVTARLMSAENTTSPGASSPQADSDSGDVLVAGRNGGDCTHFQEHMRYFIKDFHEKLVFRDPDGGEWTMCMLLWTGFAQSKDAMLDKSLRDKWLEVSKEPDQVIFLSTLTECLMHPATTHPRWTLSGFKSCKCQKDKAAGIFFTDRVVQHALRGNEESKERWKNEVVKDWFENTADEASDFLVRGNRFLREDLKDSFKGMSIFERVVETQSDVVFIKMSRLAASLLFGFLEARKLGFIEARKLDFASAAGAAGGGRTLLHGFTSFVSSEGHAFSLNPTGVPALHVIVEGLQGMVHLAHNCWEMMGPVKTAQAFLLSGEKEDEEITRAVDPVPKQPLTEPLAAGLYVCADTVSQVRLRGHVPRALPRLLHTCPHTSVYVSSYYYLCVLILLNMCPHTAIYVSSYCVAGAGARRRAACC